MNAITRAEAALIQGPTVAFELNGRQVEARAGETLLQVADREGVAIPRLCYKEGFDLAGNCRSCMVEIAGERVGHRLRHHVFHGARPASHSDSR